MSQSTHQLDIQRDAPIPTWFHIGGRAARLARPGSQSELLACLEIDDELRILGDGANLLVDDSGVANLVVSLQSDGFRTVEIDETSGIVSAGAGVALPSLISRCVRHGLAGIETLAGIPATVGGAAIMNAGGAFGSISESVLAVHAIDRAGREHAFDRAHIDYAYRQSHLNHLIVTRVVFQLTPGDKHEIKASLAGCMKYKSGSQPLGEKSAGCVFKNPVLREQLEIPDAAPLKAGERASAGMLIDRAGCKGMSVGGASVSRLHANFITTTRGALARDVIELIARVQQRVGDAFGIQLDRELVIWSDQPQPGDEP